jgi:hypothetical protein
MAKRFVEHLRNTRQRPGYEADAELLSVDMRELLREIGLAAKSAGVTSTDDSEPTST